MPLPANVTTVTVLGTFLTPEGDPSTGTISFTASSWLTNSGANVAIPNSTVTKTLGTAGNFSVSLPITDDPDISPSGFVYNVSEVVDGVSQNYNVSIPGTIAGGGTLYLADLAPVAPAGPEYYSLASSLTIGTVTTVATGGSATASITGLAPSQVLNLGIPTGATGTITTAGSGSVGTATVAPPGDPDTGIYFPAANQVAVTTGGTQALLLASGAVSNPTFTGVASFPDGSASAPSITNTGDTNTGLFHPADDTIGISTGGVERLRVNASGQIIVGDSAARTVGGISNQGIQVSGAGAARINVVRYDNNANPPSVFLAKSRNSTPGSFTVIQDGDSLGRISFIGDDGVDLNTEAARIEGQVDGSPGSDDMPGRLVFYTTADGASTLTERMRIASNGLITGTGTSLGAWTSYTPTLGGFALGSGTATGAYCQIGKTVLFRARIVLAADSTYGAAPTVSMPINARTGFGGFHVVGVFRDVSTGELFSTQTDPGTGLFTLYAVSTSGAYAVSTAPSSTVPFSWTTSDEIRLFGTYEIA